ncbi:hypothetical protein X798_03721, partial [Onchocerca flexuosa]
MGIAFNGYVLIWGQMSYWAAFFLFYSFYFSLIIDGFSYCSFVFFFLHFTGSSSSLYCHGDYDKIHFFPSFWS